MNIAIKGKYAAILCFLLGFFSVSAELNAQSSGIEQRLIGTWAITFYEDSEAIGSTWSFKSNGTFEITFYGESATGKYWATPTKLVMEIEGDGILADYYISTDGRTLILELEGELFVLTKKT